MKILKFLPALVGIILGSLMFWVGDVSDAPGFNLMGLALMFMLVMASLRLLDVVEKGQVLPIVSAVFGLGILILSIRLQVEGEFGSSLYPVAIGILTGLVLSGFSFYRMKKRVQG